jgi:hypothetical protein
MELNWHPHSLHSLPSLSYQQFYPLCPPHTSLTLSTKCLPPNLLPPVVALPSPTSPPPPLPPLVLLPLAASQRHRKKRRLDEVRCRTTQIDLREQELQACGTGGDGALTAMGLLWYASLSLCVSLSNAAPVVVALATGLGMVGSTRFFCFFWKGYHRWLLAVGDETPHHHHL